MNETRKLLQKMINDLYHITKKQDDIELSLKARGVLFWLYGYLGSIIKAIEKSQREEEEIIRQRLKRYCTR